MALLPPYDSRPIIARSETVASNPFCRGARRLRRCLIPADGFYEWLPPPANDPQERSARKQALVDPQAGPRPVLAGKTLGPLDRP
ncbi:SOS response-associated peptidase family protein [Synechococcus sp. Cruz-9H2]|nr:SOS response-associated peptidase family protein [Synechococcus sp. Cruz-9H2]MCP9842128.1 SOS response-associated peptidase family protein [Synechococcus sp. Edmonson 11F2]MCP9854769.1 SOS response-associated peptidase family protein [Synechococcus sp. Cruz-9C9]MCP9861536.1 SOS response-associated peptidase family protein [Synechococcus sp. Cruz-7E5]MCP9869281.1 SOS response-associated peptidase family protein [Synechococcus sp. Cruz-7B9]